MKGLIKLYHWYTWRQKLRTNILNATEVNLVPEDFKEFLSYVGLEAILVMWL